MKNVIIIIISMNQIIFFCTPDKQCPPNYNKLIEDKNKCIDDCQKDDTYKYEYKNICYQNEHDDETIIQDITTDNKNQIKTDQPNDENIINQNPEEEVIHYINITINNENNDIDTNIIKEIFIFSNNNSTNTDNINININNENNEKNIEIQEKVLETIKEVFDSGFNTNNVDKGKDISINIDKVSYTITTTSNQKIEENKIMKNSKIDLGSCEDKLKEYYNISKNESLYILKVDVLVDYIRKVEYDVYYPFTSNNFTKLNLTICKDIKIDISIPASIPINELDKYNKSSPLYNDICYTLTSESGTDKILKDRQDDFANNNLSVCEEDCEFTEYDYKIKKALCSCYTKIKLPYISEINFDKDKMLSNFKNIKNIGNFKMMKCMNLLYDINNIYKNSANYITVILFVLSIISVFGFFCFNIHIIEKQLTKLSNKIINNLKTVRFKSNKKMQKRKLFHLRNNKKKIDKKNKNARSMINLNFNYNNNYVKNKNKLENNKIKFNKCKTKNNIKLKKVKNTVMNKTKNINMNKHLNKKYKNNQNQKLLIQKNEEIDKIIKNNNYSDSEMNSLNYDEAKKLDKRNYCQYYMSLLRTNHILIFSFCQNKDYNAKIIKIYLFF